TANWSFAGNGNYNADSGSVAIDISKANATIDVQGYTGVYDGNAHGASGSATGVKGEDLSNLLDLGASFTNFPGDTANWSFAGNGNYNADSGSVLISISKATPSINITWSNSTYDGNANAASASVSGVGTPSENLGAADSLVYYAGNAATGSPLAGAPTNAGTYTVKAIFNGAANYNATSATRTITIAKANPQITWSTPAAIDYGTALSSAQLNASADVAGSFSYTPAAGAVLKAGNHTLKADFTPADANNYNSASAQVQIVVNPYSFTGFFQPIDNNGTLNSAKAGSTIPVKFSLGGDKGLNIFLNNQGPTTQKVACDTSAPVDTIEELSTATNSGLKYDPQANQYIYNWKTTSTYAGTCQRLTVTLADGTTVKSALFKFTK
ncbi:MAG TPA: PxKF domain-containing protein, partial [Rubrobacter sp.]|nr:PxKF domain-containing protein [Rubrobacter sp.]